nr:hypothetical protein [Tanacetum cinerariifolium]
TRHELTKEECMLWRMKRGRKEMGCCGWILCIPVLKESRPRIEFELSPDVRFTIHIGITLLTITCSLNSAPDLNNILDSFMIDLWTSELSIFNLDSADRSSPTLLKSLNLLGALVESNNRAFSKNMVLPLPF